MTATGPSQEIINQASKLGIDLNDPVVGNVDQGNVIGLRPGKRYGRRSSTMSPQEMQNIITNDDYDKIRDPADPQELFVEVTDTPVPGRKGEVEIDVSQAVTGEVAFNEMMDAFANDEKKWEQIAEGLFTNGYTSFDEDPNDIYDYDNVVAGMISAVSRAQQIAGMGGAALGFMPTVDGLLKATDPAVLQKEIDRITATKKSDQYSKATITEYANKEFKEKLHRNPTQDEVRAVIGMVHNLSGKFDLGSEIGAMAGDLDPQRAKGVSLYNTVSTVKNVLGLK
tara:strand:- start:5683 stop:6528 length:846 start_codon:yes stop_codon:yes gene_type:complete